MENSLQNLEVRVENYLLLGVISHPNRQILGHWFQNKWYRNTFANKCNIHRTDFSAKTIIYRVGISCYAVLEKCPFLISALCYDEIQNTSHEFSPSGAAGGAYRLHGCGWAGGSTTEHCRRPTSGLRADWQRTGRRRLTGQSAARRLISSLPSPDVTEPVYMSS